MEILRKARRLAESTNDECSMVLTELADRLEAATATLQAIKDEIATTDVALKTEISSDYRPTNVDRLLMKMERIGSTLSHSQVLRLMQPMKAPAVRAALNSAIKSGDLMVSLSPSKSGPPSKIYHLVRPA